MGLTSPYRIALDANERQQIERIARRHTSTYRDVVRARIVLAAADGLTNEQIGARLGVAREIVSKWRKRFFFDRLAGLDDAARSGRPVRFSPQHRRGGQGTRLSAPE
jgi:hypothetical protein